MDGGLFLHNLPHLHRPARHLEPREVNARRKLREIERECGGAGSGNFKDALAEEIFEGDVRCALGMDGDDAIRGIGGKLNY